MSGEDHTDSDETEAGGREDAQAPGLAVEEADQVAASRAAESDAENNADNDADSDSDVDADDDTGADDDTDTVLDTGDDETPTETLSEASTETPTEAAPDETDSAADDTAVDPEAHAKDDDPAPGEPPLAVPVPDKDPLARPEAAAIAPIKGSADPDHQRRKRRRRLHIHLGVWSSLTLVLLALFLVLASMSLTGRVVVMPAWVPQMVEAKLNDRMPSGSVTLRRVEFGVTPKGRPRFRLVDLGIRDATGLDIAQLNRVEGGVRAGPLLRGKLVPKSAYLSGAQVTLRRLSDGSFALSFGQSGLASGSLGAVLDGLDQLFTTGVLAEADLISADELTITLEDSRSGRIWQVTDGRMDVTQTENLVESTVRFDVFNQTEVLAETTLTFRSAKGSSEASLSASFKNAAARDIAAQTPALAALALVDAPVSGALRTTIGEDGAIVNLAGTMEISGGEVTASPGTKPIKFDGAKVYIDYAPETDRIEVAGLSVSSELGEMSGAGHVYLADFNRGWPGSLLGQISLRKGVIAAPELFDPPLELERGTVDFRLKLDPFELSIGQAVVFHGETKLHLDGAVTAGRDGWTLALDARSSGFDTAELMAIWPRSVSPGTRRWIEENVSAGQVLAPHISLRGPSLQKAKMGISGELAGVTAKVMAHLPEVTGASGYLTLGNSAMTLVVDDGEMTAADGSVLSAAGTVFHVPDVRIKDTPAVVDLALKGPTRGALELLNLKPFEVFKGTGFAPDVASGTMQGQGKIRFPLLKELPVEAVDYEVAGTLFDVRSDQLVPGSVLTAKRMEFAADPEVLTVSGSGLIGVVPVTASWRQPLMAEEAAKGSTVTGTIEISQKLVDEFNLGLPDGMIGGKGRGQFSMLMKGGQSPVLTASTNLSGVSMSIPGTGWRKGTGSTGKLDLTVVLSRNPEVRALSITAPGLSAAGSVTTKDGGYFDQARFSRVKLENWLNAPVTITGRRGAPIAIAVNGGTADFRTANFETGSGTGGAGARGPKEPLAIKLDRLIIADGIELTQFSGDFDLAGGLRGTFTSRVDNGAAIRGTVASTAQGVAYRITSAQGGEVMRDIGVFDNAVGGALEVTLAPTGRAGVYEGELKLDDTRVVNAPAMAELLAAISVVGMLDQLNGPGIGFSEVRANFSLSPKRVTLYNSHAVGVSMGISMDGYYNLDSSTMDMQGVLSPFYLLNSLGRVVSARDGEGLVGFNFNLSGPDDDLAVGINPLSILTPGVFRELFRRPPPLRPGNAPQSPPQ